MRHDEERPRTSGFLADGTVPGHWTQVLGAMRANPFTHLALDEVRTEAAHHLIVAPSPEVARACFGKLLDACGDSVEIVSGGLQELGAADVWVRPRIPLVAGEDTSPIQRFVIVADSANGVSAAVPYGEWTFIPPSLSLTFAREPKSEWLNMNVRTHVGPDGRGVANGDLADEIGYVGAVTQPLLIARL